MAVIGPASQAAVPQPRALAVDAIYRLTSRADLPSDLVDEAEDLLLRLQAVPRLITFLSSLHDHFPPLDSGSIPSAMPWCRCRPCMGCYTVSLLVPVYCLS